MVCKNLDNLKVILSVSQEVVCVGVRERERERIAFIA